MRGKRGKKGDRSERERGVKNERKGIGGKWPESTLEKL